MVKVLAIMGSPRSRGNTYKFTKLVEERMKTLGDVEFDYLFLTDINLGTCRGCRVCFEIGEDHCPAQDDRAIIADKIQSADGVIVATPVYVGNVSWLMKNFIDRFAYACHRPRFFKNVLTIATTGSAGAWFVLQLLSRSLSFMGFKTVSKLGVTCGGTYPERRSPEEKETQKNVLTKKADAAAKKFYDSLNVSPPVPGVIAIAQFLLQKAAYSKAAPESCDYRYWKNRGWLDRGAYYYYNPNAGAVKKGLAVVASKLIILGFIGR
ncbi:MAG TPA: flavodoxin family protein [Candidatus Acidoferrales bacterium]|nr:flavodoxin family protein [Candidatus Acidoferrales bacterium]